MNPSALAVHAVVDNALAKLELARRLLAETRSVDEVKMIVNLGEAALVYARQSRLGLEAQLLGCPLCLRQLAGMLRCLFCGRFYGSL